MDHEFDLHICYAQKKNVQRYESSNEWLSICINDMAYYCVIVTFLYVSNASQLLSNQTQITWLPILTCRIVFELGHTQFIIIYSIALYFILTLIKQFNQAWRSLYVEHWW